MSAVLLDGVTFTAPLVHVAFIGIRGEATVVQTPRPCVIELGNSSDLSIKDIFARAAFERFNLSTDDAVESLGLAAGGGTTLFRSTALTLAPPIKLTDLETRVVATSLDETAAVPMKPLFLIAHIKVEKLARERARSAYRLYDKRAHFRLTSGPPLLRFTLAHYRPTVAHFGPLLCHTPYHLRVSAT